MVISPTAKIIDNYYLGLGKKYSELTRRQRYCYDELTFGFELEPISKCGSIPVHLCCGNNSKTLFLTLILKIILKLDYAAVIAVLFSIF